MKTVLLYFLLVILLFFLLLPPALRIFMPKEVDPDEVEEGKNIATMLTCNRSEEAMSFKYENKVIKELFYRVPGNKSYDENPEDLENEENEIIKIIYKFSGNEYSEEDGITQFNIYFSSQELNEEALTNYTLAPNKEKTFMESMKFSCEIMEIEM